MPVKPVGSDFSQCITSAGYTWCDILGRCIRIWEIACSYPSDCLTWNDGCNTCSLVDGELGACTEMFCFQQGIPYCMVPAPEVSIEPWLIDPKPVIDPMPPVINPFLGDGH